MREYKRKSPHNKPKAEVVEKLELHLKKIEELRDGDINDRQERDTM